MFQFLIGAVLYGISATVPFLFSNSRWYYFLGAGIGIVTNLLWLNLAASLPKDRVMITGLYWDIMIVAAFILIPTLFFKTQLTTLTWCGILLIVVGIILTKVGQ